MKTFRQNFKKGDRIICWFSCGAASALATKLTLDEFGADWPVVPVYCNTLTNEHPDNARFMSDCEKWFRVPILRLSNPEYPTGEVEAVFERRKFMAGPTGAVCTGQLKKAPRFGFALPDDIHVFGFTADEEKRIESFETRNSELNLLWVLRDYCLSKQDCYQALMLAKIELPEMYKLGYHNNNCLGCVKATSPSYWAKVRRDFPAVFDRRAVQSRAIGCRLVRVDGKRIFLDELPTDREFPFELENISCGPDCGNV
jgi:hypothetical protein